MSEQKVWVEKIPESCGDCEFCADTGYCLYCSRLCIKLNYVNRKKDCPLHSIKAHDRELVRQVCAKISRFIDKMKGVKFDERKMFVELENLKIEIQKEFEK